VIARTPMTREPSSSTLAGEAGECVDAAGLRVRREPAPNC
jgi:hypothetical protein